MSNIKNWFNIISKNEIHAYNKVSNRGLAICFNFLQIPDTHTVVMTITVMKNGIKKNSLDPASFAKLMNCIENSLSNAEYDYMGHTNDTGYTEAEHFKNMKSQLTSQWYITLCCHRVLFIPECGLWETIKSLFSQDNIRIMKNNCIEEVAVYVNTEHYDFNAKFY